jgi:hypothetical protein
MVIYKESMKGQPSMAIYPMHHRKIRAEKRRMEIIICLVRLTLMAFVILKYKIYYTGFHKFRYGYYPDIKANANTIGLAQPKNFASLIYIQICSMRKSHCNSLKTTF